MLLRPRYDLDDRVLRARGRSPAAEGRTVDDEVLAHISPVHSENVGFFGVIAVDVEGDLTEPTATASDRCAVESPTGRSRRQDESDTLPEEGWAAQGRPFAPCR